MKPRIALVSLVLLLFCLLASSSYAVMHRINFNAFTQAQKGQPQMLIVFVEVIDDQLSHPPDFVKEVRITAPDGSIFYLNLSKDWLPWDKAFYKGFVASDFVGKVIPGGTYTVRVTPDVGSAISESDSVAANFLPIPVVTYPTPGMTGVPEIPTFAWDAVKGATFYRILLVNMDWPEPVYFYGLRYKNTDFTSYRIPPGDLKPNTHYIIRIEARSGSQDMDMRSHTGWISFTTGAW